MKKNYLFILTLLIGQVVFSQGLPCVLEGLNASYTSVVAAVPNAFIFNYDGTNNINDGGSDMYDGGNVLNTDLAANIPYSDNVITTDASFGTTGQYFTREYDGLFVMAADLDNVSTFEITGNNGADGNGSADGYVFSTTVNANVYDVFVKRVHSAGDPSINHVMIIPQNVAASHTFAASTDNDQHSLNGITASTRIYYLLYAGTSGFYIDNPATELIVDAFLGSIAGGALYLENATYEGTEMCAGTTLDVDYNFCGLTINTGNDFVIELSDATGSFAIPTQIGILNSTTLGTVSCLIPNGTASGSDYKVRVSATNVAQVGTESKSFTINETPVIPTLISATTDACPGVPLVLEVQTDSSDYIGIVDVLFSGLVGQPSSWCGPNSMYNNCSEVMGLSWYDFTNSPVISAQIEFVIGAEYNTAFTHTTTLNGLAGDDFLSTPYNSSCAASGSVVVDLEPLNYEANGLNTFLIPTSNINCMGFFLDGTFGANVWAKVTVVYKEENEFTWSSVSCGGTFENSGATFAASPSAATTYYVSAENEITGCLSTCLDVVVNVSDLDVTSTAANVSCNGLSDGTIFLNVTSSTVFTEDFGGANPAALPAGNYTYTVTDVFGCVQTDDITITEPAVLALSSTTIPSQPGQNNGVIDLTVTGGTMPYSYLWNTAHTVEDLTNMAEGAYSVDVTDANGCTATLAIDILLSLNELGAGTEVSIYPNPTSDFFTLKVVGAELSSYFITNSLGQIVDRNDNVSNNSQEIDLSSFGRGVYFVNVIASEKTAIYKVILQ
jgi:hypothetical protein